MKSVELALFPGFLIWLIVFAVDLAADPWMFSRGPIKMPFTDHLADKDVTCLMIPVIPIGMGAFLERADSWRKGSPPVQPAGSLPGWGSIIAKNILLRSPWQRIKKE
jgi:hypothetical protein